MISNIINRFNHDPAGNSLAVFVLLCMLYSLVRNGYKFYLGNPTAGQKRQSQASPNWLVPILCLVGFLIAAYLSFIETTKNVAFCGPIGDCNSVQQSVYAKLLGIIPIGIVGMVGYVAIAASWIMQTYGHAKWRVVSILAMGAMVVFGILFSIYLTFLEPFVIGTTCIWCLSTAVVMTLLLWVVTNPVIQAWQEWNEA